MDEYTLCFKYKHDPFDWVCERGYSNIDEADKRAKELKNSDTVIIPTNKYLPQFVARGIVKYKLSPGITMRKIN